MGFREKQTRNKQTADAVLTFPALPGGGACPSHLAGVGPAAGRPRQPSGPGAGLGTGTGTETATIPRAGTIPGTGALPGIRAVPGPGMCPGSGAVPGIGAVPGVRVVPGSGAVPTICGCAGDLGLCPGPKLCPGSEAVPGRGLCPAVPRDVAAWPGRPQGSPRSLPAGRGHCAVRGQEELHRQPRPGAFRSCCKRGCENPCQNAPQCCCCSPGRGRCRAGCKRGKGVWALAPLSPQPAAFQGHPD